MTLRCKRCRRDFPSGISIGWVSKPVLGEREHECRHCGATALYASRDYKPVIEVPMWAMAGS